MLASGVMKSQTAAQFALDLPHVMVGVPYADLIQVINQYILSTWKDDWNGVVKYKLHSVKPFLEDWQSAYRQCTKDKIVCFFHTCMRHICTS